jgi:hypothetical protein
MAQDVDANFPGAEKHEISLEEAKKHIQRHTLNPIYPNHHGGSFDRAAIDKILAQPGCNALRVYHGRDENGKPNLVLVGIDTDGKDMTKESIMEKGMDCPPNCDQSSELLA